MYDVYSVLFISLSVDDVHAYLFSLSDYVFLCFFK